MLKGLIEDTGLDDEFELPEIKKSCLDKVIEFCTHVALNDTPNI